jgi:hypothetical protein
MRHICKYLRNPEGVGEESGLPTSNGLPTTARETILEGGKKMKTIEELKKEPRLNITQIGLDGGMGWINLPISKRPLAKGVKGEFYPCKPDVFEATYEPVKEE